MKVFLSDGIISPRDVDWLNAQTYQLDGWYIIRDGKDYMSIVEQLTHENMFHVISIGNLHNMTGMTCTGLLMDHCMRHDIDPPILFCHLLDNKQFNHVVNMWEKYLRLYFNKPKIEKDEIK